MKRTIIKLLMAAWLVVVAAAAVYEFRGNKVAEYYASRPEQAAYALALAVVVGAAIFLYARLSARAQRRAKLAVLGSVAQFLSIFSGYMLFVAASMVRVSGYFAPVDGHFVPVAIMSLVWAALAALFWLGFYYVLKWGQNTSPRS
jgi:hypothetical protein